MACTESLMQLIYFFYRSCSVAQNCVCPLQVHTLGNKSRLHLHWITPECLDGRLRQHWDGLFFFVLLCLGSFHSAKVGLVCSHVWLGHLLAHTNDPNWESGLRFRVTDRLTGMWGMWPSGTRPLSEPSYQLAAYCNGHLFSCLSPLFSQSQVEKTDLTFWKLVLQTTDFCAITWLLCYIPVCSESCFFLLLVFSNILTLSFPMIPNLTSRTSLSWETYSHLTWEVSAHSVIFLWFSAQTWCLIQLW